MGEHACEWKEEAEAQREYAEAVIASTKSRKRTAELIAERDVLRAELDSLRNRVNALADDAVFADFGQHQPFDGDDEEVVLAVRQSDLRAIVRGSDDE